MSTTPLPAFPLSRLTPAPAVEQEQGTSPRKTELYGLVFVSKPQSESKINSEDDPEQQQKDDEVLEGVRAILLYDEKVDGATSVDRRICLSTLEIEKREVKLAESFKDIVSDTVETSRSWDWIVVHRSESVTKSPAEWMLLALYPLSSLLPSSLALALLQTPKGVALSHIDLAHTPAESEGGQWSALRGASIHISDDINPLDLGLIVSQGVERGEKGLVAITNRDDGALLLVGPALRSSGGSEGSGGSVSEAEIAARSIILAMKQETGWSDVIRAAFGSKAMLDRERGEDLTRTELGEQILRSSYKGLDEEDDLDELKSIFSLQVAVYHAMGDGRRETAAELIRLLEASYLFSRCAMRGPNKKIQFDLESVWSLIGVADWVSGVLATMMREIILQRGRYEWIYPEEPEGAPPIRILYLLHPSLRALVLRLHSQLQAFIDFVLSLDRPIPHVSQPGLMAIGSVWDPRATVLAKENVRDVLGKTGIDLSEWGRAITTLSRRTSSDIASPVSISDEDYRHALLSLSCEPFKTTLREVISALPAPSSLFRSTSNHPETVYDAITLDPLPNDVTALVGCGRCGWKTGALGNGLTGMGRWGEWRKGFERVCVCGGTWTRASKLHTLGHD